MKKIFLIIVILFHNKGVNEIIFSGNIEAKENFYIFNSNSSFNSINILNNLTVNTQGSFNGTVNINTINGSNTNVLFISNQNILSPTNITIFNLPTPPPGSEISYLVVDPITNLLSKYQNNPPEPDTLTCDALSVNTIYGNTQNTLFINNISGDINIGSTSNSSNITQDNQSGSITIAGNILYINCPIETTNTVLNFSGQVNTQNIDCQNINITTANIGENNNKDTTINFDIVTLTNITCDTPLKIGENIFGNCFLNAANILQTTIMQSSTGYNIPVYINELNNNPTPSKYLAIDDASLLYTILPITNIPELNKENIVFNKINLKGNINAHTTYSTTLNFKNNIALYSSLNYIVCSNGEDFTSIGMKMKGNNLTIVGGSSSNASIQSPSVIIKNLISSDPNSTTFTSEDINLDEQYSIQFTNNNIYLHANIYIAPSEYQNTFFLGVNSNKLVGKMNTLAFDNLNTNDHKIDIQNLTNIIPKIFQYKKDYCIDTCNLTNEQKKHLGLIAEDLKDLDLTIEDKEKKIIDYKKTKLIEILKSNIEEIYMKIKEKNISHEKCFSDYTKNINHLLRTIKKIISSYEEKIKIIKALEAELK